MAIVIDEASANIEIKMYPTVAPPSASGGVAHFESTPIRANGSVRLNGQSGDTADNWTLGFIQVQWIETNRLYYRGRAPGGGSILIDRGQPPARPVQGCRDVGAGAVSDIWYNILHNYAADEDDTVPAVLSASFVDRPFDLPDLIEKNATTKEDNFLREAQIEYHFCLVLALSDPHGRFHQLCSVYWNVHWQAVFGLPDPHKDIEITHWPTQTVERGTSATVGHLIRGEVTDLRFRDLITGPATQNCNQIAKAAKEANKRGQGRVESRTW